MEELKIKLLNKYPPKLGEYGEGARTGYLEAFNDALKFIQDEMVTVSSEHDLMYPTDVSCKSYYTADALFKGFLKYMTH